MDGRPGLLCNGENLPLFIQWAGDCHKVLFGQGVIKASEELGMKKKQQHSKSSYTGQSLLLGYQ